MAFLLGHESIKDSGVTVILSENGATGGVSVRGSAPATRETDLLRSENSVDLINAVVLSGGSAYGLDACSGVVEYLREIGVGFDAGGYKVPIVAGASLYDLEYGEFGLPDAALGYKCAKNAALPEIKTGNIGAGTGATVGKILGMSSASKGGLGMAEYRFEDFYAVAIVAVNAFGNVYDYHDGSFIGGATLGENQIDIVQAITANLIDSAPSNTTIGCIITNAKLSKAQANKLADIAHDGYAMTIRPVHTPVDGDAVFVMADNEVEVDFMRLCCIFPTLMANAVISVFKE